MNWNEYVQYICLLDKKALIFIMLIIMIEILNIGLIIDIYFKKLAHLLQNSTDLHLRNTCTYTAN